MEAEADFDVFLLATAAQTAEAEVSEIVALAIALASQIVGQLGRGRSEAIAAFTESNALPHLIDEDELTLRLIANAVETDALGATQLLGHLLHRCLALFAQCLADFAFVSSAEKSDEKAADSEHQQGGDISGDQ